MRYEKDGIIGWGEAAPGKNENAGSVEEVESQLNILIAEGIENKTTQENTSCYGKSQFTY